MKQVHANYTFNASTKTITLTGLNIAQDQLLLVTNATRGVIYYNFASSSHRAVVTAGANTTVVLTDASTTGHSDSDQLAIHYDDQLSTQTVAGTVTANPQFFTTITAQTITGGENGLPILFLNNCGLYDVTFSAPIEYVVEAGFTVGNSFVTTATIPLTTPFGNTITGSYHIGSLFRRPTPQSSLSNTFRLAATTTAGTAAPFTATFRAVSDSYYGLNRPVSGTVTVGNSVTIGSLPAINLGTANAIYETQGFNADKCILIGTASGRDGVVYPVSIEDPIVAGGSYDTGNGFLRVPISVDIDGKIKIGSLPTVSGTVTVGNSVTISSLPAISGTVTANLSSVRSLGQIGNSGGLLVYGSTVNGNCYPIPLAGDGSLQVYGSKDIVNDAFAYIPLNNGASAVFSEVTSLPAISGTVTVGNTVTISGTVTANPTGTQTIAGTVTMQGVDNDSGGALRSIVPLPIITGGETQNNGNRIPVTITTDQGNTFLNSNYGGIDQIPVYVYNSVTIGSLPAISGTVTANVGNGSNLIGGGYADLFSYLDNVAPSVVINGAPVVNGTLPISGTVTVGNSVTIGSVPNGSLTTRFGSVTTANTAEATSAVTNASRKYLLIQNVTTGSNVITVGIGFTPTTTQGIQLTAGAGITFESSYIPTGAVYVLSSVTASNFTVLEA